MLAVETRSRSAHRQEQESIAAANVETPGDHTQAPAADQQAPMAGDEAPAPAPAVQAPKGRPVSDSVVTQFRKGQISPELWLSLFNDHGLLHAMDDDTRLAQFNYFVDQYTQDWKFNLPASQKDTWANLQTAFLARFSVSDPLADSQALYTCQQRQDQPVNDFIHEMQKRATKCNLPEQNLIHLLINNVLPAIKADLIRAKPSTINQVLEVAKTAELANSTVNSHTVSALDAMQNQFTHMCKQMSAVQDQMSQVSNSVAALQAPSTFNNHHPSNFNFKKQYSPKPQHFQNPPAQSSHQNSSFNQRKPLPCLSCSSNDHPRYQCPHRQDTCTLCQTVGHIAKACRKHTGKHLRDLNR